MSEFRRWKGKTLKESQPTLTHELMTLGLLLSGALSALLLVFLLCYLT